MLGAAKLASGYPVLAAVSATLVTIGFGVLAFSMMGWGVPPASRAIRAY